MTRFLKNFNRFPLRSFTPFYRKVLGIGSTACLFQLFQVKKGSLMLGKPFWLLLQRNNVESLCDFMEIRFRPDSALRSAD